MPKMRKNTNAHGGGGVMGRSEIFQFLKKSPQQKFTSAEIAKSLNITQVSVAKSLRNMRKFQEIGFDLGKHLYGGQCFIYWHKQRE